MIQTFGVLFFFEEYLSNPRISDGRELHQNLQHSSLTLKLRIKLFSNVKKKYNILMKITADLNICKSLKA